jgi:hypothetical protein
MVTKGGGPRASAADSGGGSEGRDASSTGAPGEPSATASRDAAVPMGSVSTTEVDPSVHNYVFVTSEEYMADFGELTVADAHCDALAAQAGLAGTYVAWLSTSTVDARDRLPETSHGWARPDGLVFALSRRSLIAGEILYPPRLDETGADSEESYPLVFTGTEADGTFYTGGRYDHCADWTSTDTGRLFRSGTPSGGPLLWTAGGGADCGARARLYCFGTDNAVDHEHEPATGRLAFVSEAELVPGGGLDAADALCQSEAEASGFAGEFAALLATSSASAASRFADGEPWVRPDGAAIAARAASLLRGDQLASPIAQQADGKYVSALGVWTGASDVVTAPGIDTHCNDWTSTAGDGNTGMAAYTGQGYFDVGTAPCSATYLHVYCLQR